LLYYGYRYYNASTGRWLSCDPYREAGFEATRGRRVRGLGRLTLVGERGHPNLFAFIRNVPVGDFDFLGLCGGKCGPDATSLVYRTLGDIAEKYGAASWYMKLDADVNMFGPGALFTWDIKYLFNWEDLNNPAKECQRTVTFEGMCVNAQELNYIMFGWGIKLCDEPVNENINLLYHALWARYEAHHLGSWADFGDDAGSIARKVGFAAYGAGVYSKAPSWLAWPYSCTGSTEKLNEDFHEWRWWGIQGGIYY
jgi:hypothetical protein